MTFIPMGLGLALGLRLGDIRGSGETGDSKEEEDTQWRQDISLYTIKLRMLADSVYFVRSYMK